MMIENRKPLRSFMLFLFLVCSGTMAGESSVRIAPFFVAKTSRGEAVNNPGLAKFNATVLNFVAPNSGFCLKQAPVVEEVRKDYSQKNVRFLTVIQKLGKKEFTATEAETIFNDHGSRSETVVDFENKFSEAFKVSSYPTLILMDKYGRIEAVTGMTPNLKATLVDKLDKTINSSDLEPPVISKRSDDNLPPLPSPFDPKAPPVVPPPPKAPERITLMRHFSIDPSREDATKTETWSFGSEYAYISHRGLNPNCGGKNGVHHGSSTYYDPATNSIVVNMWKKADSRFWGIGEPNTWISFDIEVTLERR